MKRAVFIDVDGTLLDHNQEVPDSARDALGKAIEAGHSLILCTGRGRPEIYPFLWDLGFSGLIGCNGAYGELGGRIVFNDHIGEDEVAEISSWLNDARADYLWGTGLEMYPGRNFLKLFQSSDDLSDSIAGDWTTYLQQIQPYLRDGVPETAAKVTFFLSRGSGVKLADAQARFGDRFCIVPGSLPEKHGETGELTALGMDKSVGLRKMADLLGVSLGDTVALGDSANDIEMLRVAGTGVAMGNGTEEAKASAAWTTADIREDGLALAFERLGLLSS